MEITRWTLKKKPANGGQNGITEVAMQRWHRSGLNTPEKPVTHHQIVPLSQLFQKGSKIIEIIAVVGVTHNYVFSMGGRDTSHECVPVSFPLYTNYQRAQTSRNLLRAVGAPVVGDEHFAIDSQVFERGFCFADTHSQRFGFI